MLETVAQQTVEEVAVQVLDFALPDPTAANYENHLEAAWAVCDRLDLQTEIWRGRLLRSVRDREKEQSGSFEKWLGSKELTRSRAYRLIELADCADRFLKEHPLQEQDLNHFSKAAFISTARAEGPVQTLIVEQALRGERVTQKRVENLQEEWLLANDQYLPDTIREKVLESALPSRPAAKAAHALAQLPAAERQIFCEALTHQPDVATLRQVALDAQAISRTLSELWRVQVIGEEALVREALGEAARQGVLSQTLEILRWAGKVERSLSQLYTSWQRLGILHQQLDAVAETPSLQNLLTALEPLTQPNPAIDIGEVRLSAEISCQERWVDVPVLAEH